jgi:hypothetical protein
MARAHTHTHTHTHIRHTQILDHNPLGLKGFAPIINHSKANDSRLTRLSLQNTSLDVDCAQQCANALDRNAKLLHLALDDNRHILDDGVAMIAESLASPHLSLKSLSLRNVGASKFQPLRQALTLNVSLNTIHCDDASVANFLDSTWFAERVVSRIWHRVNNNKMMLGLYVIGLTLVGLLVDSAGSTNSLGLQIFFGLLFLLVFFGCYDSFYK